MKTFDQIKEQIAKEASETGQHIDAGVLDTVAALAMRGFKPVDACEGHSDRVTGGPFVMFEAAESKELLTKLQGMADQTSDEFQQTYQKASQANLGEVQKILPLLEEFYTERDTPHSERLIVRCFGPSVPKLVCQNADLGEILDEDERHRLLSDNQLEMMAFTNFLREQ